jgi:tRNA(adenine34) deaminase
MNKYIEILKKMNNLAKNNGDIPVSAIILKENSIISKAYNKKYKNNNPLDHAEIIAIKKACKKLNTNNLIDCTLLVTLKPCNMCKELIKEVRLKNVYYILDNNKEINDTTKYYKINDSESYFNQELIRFFKDKR